MMQSKCIDGMSVSVQFGDIGRDDLDLAMKVSHVGWDIETSGLDWRNCKIGTCQLSIAEEKVVVIQMREEIPDNLPLENALLGTGIWKQVYLVIGPYFSLPLPNLNFDAFALIGINVIMPPEMKITAFFDEISYSRNFSVQSVSYAVDLGIALRYHLNENYSLRMFSSYFQSNSKGTVREEFDLDGDGNSDIEERDQSLTIQSVNLGIGIVYRF